uniref:Uncharacterized protein n=1 Tax=Anguilla anguilla TaxID=7936 RepID=A0A0E9U3H8_ANGAN
MVCVLHSVNRLKVILRCTYYFNLPFSFVPNLSSIS